jgi:hypothetical protein
MKSYITFRSTRRLTKNESEEESIMFARNHKFSTRRIEPLAKITVNHNTSMVRAAGVESKITVNHNTTLVRGSQAK